MARIKVNELTPRRFYDAVARRVEEVPHSIAWQRSDWARENRARLEAMRGRHSGQRCFLMGNGPSLSNMDLSPLKQEITFGLNRIYLLFDQLPFEPTYYACVNGLVVEQFADEIRQLHMPKFINWTQRRLFDRNDTSVLFVKEQYAFNDHFQVDITKPVLGCGTVTFIAMQIAYYLGFEKVILIGVDHSFAYKGAPNTTQVQAEKVDVNHFHPDYFPKGVKWQLPDLSRTEIGYRIARNAYEKAGRRIVDATVGGKLQVFEKVEYASLF